MFSLIAITPQYMFWQEIRDNKNNLTTNYLYAFESDSLKLSKIILINYSTSYEYYESNNQDFPYSFIFNFKQGLQMLQYDGEVTQKTYSINFPVHEDGGLYFYIGYVSGKYKYFAYSKMLNYNSIQFGYSTFLSKMNSFLDFDTCQNYTVTDISENYQVIDYASDPTLAKNVYETNSSVNIRREISFDLYNSTSEWNGYQIANIKDWIYPRYTVALTGWSAALPNFILNNKLKVNIGTNVQNPKLIVPFNSCN